MDLQKDYPKEVIDKAYDAIEIARDTGKIKKGVNEVTKIIERGQAKLVAIAKDVNPQEIIMHFPPLCDEKETPLIIVPSKKDLGAAAGLQVATSAVAIVSEGNAQDLLKEVIKKIAK